MLPVKRPASATTRKSNFAAKPVGSVLGTRVAASTSAIPSRTANAGTPPAAEAAATPTHLEDALVRNLKQQIACLELEVKYMKEQKPATPAAVVTAPVEQPVAAAAPTPSVAQSFAAAAPVAPTEQSLVADAIRSSANTLDFRASHGDLLNHAQRLEQEVVSLREKFAVREQEHALELAGQKSSSEVGGLSRAHGAAATFKQELDTQKNNFVVETNTLKEEHAQEVVALNKTIERLRLEHMSAVDELRNSRREKDHAVKDLISAKDGLRTAVSEADTAKKQHEEAMNHINSEQERRRQAEIRADTLQKELQGLRTDRFPQLDTRIEELEKALRESNAGLHYKTYELEQSKVTVEKLSAELRTAANERADVEAKLLKSEQGKTDAQKELETTKTTLSDVTAERDFYRLSTDRLKVDHSVLEVKLAQQEAKINSDRASILSLEKQYCEALEAKEQMSRDSRAKEEVYRNLDAHDDAVRRSNKLLSDENDKLKEANNRLALELRNVAEKYDAVRNYADQAKAEQQIMHALGKLDKTKAEFQHMMSTQMKISQEITSAMYELPDTNSVSRMMSPSNTTTGGVNVSAVSDATPRPAPIAPAAPLVEEQPAAVEKPLPQLGYDAKTNTVTFYSSKEAYGFMANFAETPFVKGGHRWSSSEHYFQAHKFITSPKDFEEVRDLPSAKDAAKAGRDRSRPLRADWETAKLEVMYDGVKAKFAQNKIIQEELLRTGDAKIVEHSDKDNYWGNGGDGSGKNMLGAILMRVRESLREEAKDAAAVPAYPVAVPTPSASDVVTTESPTAPIQTRPYLV